MSWVGANLEVSRRWDYVEAGDGFKGRCMVEMKGIFGGKSGANKGAVRVVFGTTFRCLLEVVGRLGWCQVGLAYVELRWS